MYVWSNFRFQIQSRQPVCNTSAKVEILHEGDMPSIHSDIVHVGNPASIWSNAAHIALFQSNSASIWSNADHIALFKITVKCKRKIKYRVRKKSL